MANLKEFANNISLGVLAYQNAKRRNDVRDMEDQLSKIKLNTAELNNQKKRMQLTAAKKALKDEDAFKEAMKSISESVLKNAYQNVGSENIQKVIYGRQSGQPSTGKPPLTQIGSGLKTSSDIQPVPAPTRQAVESTASQQQAAVQSVQPEAEEAVAVPPQDWPRITYQDDPAAAEAIASSPEQYQQTLSQNIERVRDLEAADPKISIGDMREFRRQGGVDPSAPPAEPPAEVVGEEASALAPPPVTTEEAVAPVAGEEVVETSPVQAAPTGQRLVSSLWDITDEHIAASKEARQGLIKANVPWAEQTKFLTTLPGTVEYQQARQRKRMDDFEVKTGPDGSFVLIDKTGQVNPRALHYNRMVTTEEAKQFGVSAGTWLSDLIAEKKTVFNKDLFFTLKNSIYQYSPERESMTPLVTIPAGLTPEEQTAMTKEVQAQANWIRSHLKTENSTKNAYKAWFRYRQALKVYHTDQASGFRDYALVKMFERVLDPDSAVRQSEFDAVLQFAPGLIAAFRLTKDKEGSYWASANKMFFGKGGYLDSKTKGDFFVQAQRDALMKALTAIGQGNREVYNQAVDREHAGLTVFANQLGAENFIDKKHLGYIIQDESDFDFDGMDAVLDQTIGSAAELGQRYMPVGTQIEFSPEGLEAGLGRLNTESR